MTAQRRFGRDEWLFIILALAALASAIAFILTNNVLVFDDEVSMRDIGRYASDGVSLATLNAHVNPAGPLSYAWIAVIGDALGGSLKAFRSANLITAILVFALFWFNRQRFDAAKSMLLMLLMSPYLALTSVSLLTEMPALLLVSAGTLAWIRGLDQPSTAKGQVLMALGGLCIGLAITGRQYYLAALPAMGAILLFKAYLAESGKRLQSILFGVPSLIMAVLPIALLTLLWGELTSPGMRSGASYSGTYAGIGISLMRPLSTALYLGQLLIFPLVLRKRPPREWLSLIVASGILGVAIALLTDHQVLWCDNQGEGAGCGPVTQLYAFALSKGALAGFGFTAISAAAGIFGLAAMVLHCVRAWKATQPDMLTLFSALLVAAFIAEQAFIGGNIPFYERYLLQITPALGVLIHTSDKRDQAATLVGMLPLMLLGQIRLWKL